jgi:hypothetical protein
MAFCAALSVILPRSTESFGCNPQAQREAVVWLQFPMKTRYNEIAADVKCRSIP